MEKDKKFIYKSRIGPKYPEIKLKLLLYTCGYVKDVWKNLKSLVMNIQKEKKKFAY